MNNKEFPLEFDLDEEEGQLFLYLKDGTLIIDLETYRKSRANNGL